MQLLAHERDAVGARGDAAQLVGELADGVGRDQAHIAHADVAEVEAIEFEAGHGCVDAFEGRKRHVGLADAPVGRQQAACELVPGEAFRIASRPGPAARWRCSAGTPGSARRGRPRSHRGCRGSGRKGRRCAAAAPTSCRCPRCRSPAARARPRDAPPGSAPSGWWP